MTLISRLLSRSEAAARLGVSLRTFDLHARSGLPAVRIGRCVRFRPEDVDAWVAQHADGRSGSGTESGASDSACTSGKSSEAPVYENLNDWPPSMRPQVSTQLKFVPLANDVPKWRKVLAGSSRRPSNG